MGDKRGGQRRPSNEGEACATAHAANSRTKKKIKKDNTSRIFKKNTIELRITRAVD